MNMRTGKTKALTKSAKSILLLLAMLVMGQAEAWADELTIYNSATSTSYEIPIYAYNADTNGDRSEFVVPSSMLSDMAGTNITSITFYCANFSWGTKLPEYMVYMKEVASATLSAYATETDATTVYTGVLALDGTKITIVFSTPYEYSGGNLLVGTKVTTAGSYVAKANSTFYGSTASDVTCSRSSVGNKYFTPKTTFTYESSSVDGPAFVVKDGSKKLTSPYAYDFGLATAGTTKTFTLSNPGTAAVEGLSVSETGSFGATLSATSIAVGGEATLTITMPSTTGTSNSTITISSTTEGIADFVINASGTVRDPNKVYLDFSGGTIPDDWTSVRIGSSGSAWTASDGYISQSGSSSSYEWAFTSPKLTFTEGETIFFETAKYGSSDYTTPSIKVQYSTDGSNWTTIGSAFTDDVYGTWTKRSVTIPTADAKYIRFSGWYIHMRNIYGGELPLNPEPKYLTVSYITNTTAQIGWTSTASSFNIQYKASGDGDWTTLSNKTDNPYTLTGLTAETKYQVKVQANHGVNGLSDYTDPISFTTKTNPVTAYPYTENFNSLSSGQIPAHWDNSEGTTTNDSYKWVYYATGHDGACLRFNSYYNQDGITNFLKTRPFSFTEGQPMRLTFWYKNPAGGDFSVYASTDGGTTYPTQLATGLTGKSDWTEKEIDIPASVYGENVVIVFKGTSNYASGDAYIYLDDVTVSEKLDYSMSITGSDVSENTIAFGTVKNNTTTKTFTITNDGGNDLTGVSVVSSDAEVFTVSETGFDLAAGATKDITVTFVKNVDGDYTKTITISQANIATPIVLTVTATYQTPTPATMAITVDEAAVGATVAFGIANKQKVKTFTVTNTGEATLNITSLASSNTTDFTVSPATLTVEGGATENFTVTFVWDGDALDAEKTANITVTPSNVGLDPIVFTVTGTRVEMWSEDFEGGEIPAGWENNGFQVKTGTIGSYPQYTLDSYVAVGNGGSNEKTLITPLLKATAGDKLTFDGFFYYGDETMKVDYSTDLSSWNNLYTYDKESYTSGTTHNIEIESAITGEFYLRFTVNYYNGIDNIEGFKLAPKKEHEATIASSSIPASGNQYVDYTATVTVREKAGKDDEMVTAELWIGTTKVATESGITLTANDDKEISLTFTPDAAMSGDAYIKVYNGTLDLTTSTQAVEIAAATVLDETVGLPDGLATGTKPSVLVKYTAKSGWNTICMPFELTSGILTSIFGDGWKAYEFYGYADGALKFRTPSTFYAGYPYIIYVETAATHAEGVKLFGTNVAQTTAKADTYSDVSFQGRYAPVAAGEWAADWYGVTSSGKLQKGNTETSYMKGFRAYFTGIAASASLSLNFEDSTTGITTVVAGSQLTEDDNIYNLNGQKVNAPDKGLYIINGRKVVVK